MYLLVHEDDITLIRNEDRFIKSFVIELQAEFYNKDLRCHNFFLRFEVLYIDNGLLLSQSKYAHDILQRANRLDAEPGTTLLGYNVVFVTSGEIFDDLTHYLSLVGTL